MLNPTILGQVAQLIQVTESASAKNIQHNPGLVRRSSKKICTKIENFSFLSGDT
jgi:hypothetical protein